MGTNAYYLNQFISTTLATVGGIDDSQTTGIILTSVTGVETTKPGIVCLSYSDPIDTSKAEWISYTSISVTNELQGVTRGAEGFSAKSHSNGVTIAFPISESHINNLNNALVIDGVATNLVTGTLDEDDMASNSATALATQQSIKAYIDGGWSSANETWTYASSTTFTVASDVTDKYQKGDKIKFTQATDGVKYMYIVGVSESGGTTTITVTGGSDYDLDNEAITANYYSHASNPIGFPDWFEYTATITAGVGSITTAAETSYFSIKEKTVFVRNIIVTTTNGTGSDSVRFSLPVTAHASLSCGGGGRSLQNGHSISVTLSSTTVAAYYTYNNAYPGGDGYAMQGGLFYQMA